MGEFVAEFRRTQPDNRLSRLLPLRLRTRSVRWLPEYVGLGIDGVSIGSNDLTQPILGVDRDSEHCAELFADSDPAVLKAISRIIGTAR